MRYVKGGNSQLIAALAHALEGHIHYTHPLRKITRSADQKIWLHFDGESQWTDYLILAIPCTTLCDIDIEEGIFPEDQQSAIGMLQYGTNAKILLPISHLGEIRTECILTENWVLWTNVNHTVMTYYCGGEPGVFDSSSPESLSSIIESQVPRILQVYPQTQFPHGLVPTVPGNQMFAHYDKPVGISWAHEEFSKGGYSNYGLGTFALFDEFIDDYQEAVRRPFRSIGGHIFFAGEHTAPRDENGTMNGAVYSGERAARMLQRALIPFAENKCIFKRVKAAAIERS
jgi:monoamine oxidase